MLNESVLFRLTRTPLKEDYYYERAKTKIDSLQRALEYRTALLEKQNNKEPKFDQIVCFLKDELQNNREHLTFSQSSENKNDSPSSLKGPLN